MDNTVGSLAKNNRYWQKEWIKIKESLCITEKQKSFIVGTILGDGTLRVIIESLKYKITLRSNDPVTT